MATFTDLGPTFDAFHGLSPQALAAAGNGSAADRLTNRQAYLSGKLVLSLGAKGGTVAPTSFSVVAKVQHSSDNSTWTDYAVDGTTVATSALTSENASAEVNFTLLPAKRYVRAVVTPTFTGGTDPTILACATLNLGGGRNDPVS